MMLSQLLWVADVTIAANMVLLLLLNIKLPSHVPLLTCIFNGDYKFILTSQLFGFEQITFTFGSFNFTSLQI